MFPIEYSYITLARRESNLHSSRWETTTPTIALRSQKYRTFTYHFSIFSNRLIANLAKITHRASLFVPLTPSRHRTWRGHLVGASERPVGEVLDQLVAELHLLAEGQVVPAPHHRLHQLAEARLDVQRQHRRVQVPHVSRQLV